MSLGWIIVLSLLGLVVFIGLCAGCLSLIIGDPMYQGEIEPDEHETYWRKKDDT